MKALVSRRFQPGEGPSRGLLRDCGTGRSFYSTNLHNTGGQWCWLPRVAGRRSASIPMIARCGASVTNDDSGQTCPECPDQPQCHYCDHCPIIICPRVRLKMTTHLAAGNIWCLSSRNELRLLWELDIQTSKARESFYNLVFAKDSRSIST